MILVLTGLGAAVVAAVIVTQRDPGERQANSSDIPSTAATTVSDIADPVPVDHFPLIDEADIPPFLQGPLLGCFCRQRTERQGWHQTLAAGSAAQPTDVIEVGAYPGGEYQPSVKEFPDAVPGRRADILQSPPNRFGWSALIWGSPSMRFGLFGEDIGLTYQLVDLIAPMPT